MTGNDKKTAPKGTRIVVGVDFTDTSDVALAYGIRLAKPDPDSHLDLVTVVSLDNPERGKDVAAVDAEVGQAQDRLRRYFVDRCYHLFPGQHWDQAITMHVRLGDPAEELHQVAVDVEADLIIVGTHGRKGLERFVLGSVASDLVGRAHVPVLVARKPRLEGLEKSPEPEPARPGEQLTGERGFSQSEHVQLRPPRTSHIAGLV